MPSASPRRQPSNVLPVVPVRDTVHFPGVIQTLMLGRKLSLSALDAAMRYEQRVVIVGQRDQSVELPKREDLYKVGTVSEILHVLPLPDGNARVVFRGIERFQIEKFTSFKNLFRAQGRAFTAWSEADDETEALKRECHSTFLDALQLGLSVPPEVPDMIDPNSHPLALGESLAHHLPVSASIKQDLLETEDLEAFLLKLLSILAKERQLLELQSALRTKVEAEIGQTQREYLLREQLRAIQSELGGDDALSREGEEFKAKILQCHMPQETKDKALEELRRFERAPSSSPEGMVIRNYLDWLTTMPWDTLSADMIDVKIAGQVLDRDHFGLDKVKSRILDFLAVRQLTHSLRGPILCFVGPPGVGKTSIGRSIAESLGRKFIRLSLGGVRDEAEIRGHRRTYIGSMPGRIVQSIKHCGTRNPVFMLDEIDKMTKDFRGDPTSALLEALDPEQNSQFSDHYLEVPFDLSAVMFIATANLLENVPPALRDRMETIHFPSYTEQEKLAIASQYLVPKKLTEHGLQLRRVAIGEDSLKMLIRSYTREAGVRWLERELATLCRKAARQFAEGRKEPISLNPDLVLEMLGKPRFRYGQVADADEVGAATGMVFSEFGGDIITIEVSLMPPLGEQPTVKLTGSLGDVMKESAFAATTYVRSNQDSIGMRKPFHFDVHVHVPEGAVPKDGPSAGVAICTALVSAFTGTPVRRDVAMTGEITLRGKVLPVGGLRDKLIAAHRAGILSVVVPKDNERDLEDLPENVRAELQFHLVGRIEEVLAAALRYPSDR